MSRASLAATLALPKSTVVGLVEDLIERGLVVEQEAGPQGRGRPAKLLTLAGPRRVLGVAVWSVGRLRVAIAEPSGTILGASDEPVDSRQGVEPALERLDT